MQVHKKGTVKGATGYLTKNGEIVNEGGEILYKSEREKQVADDADSTRVLRRDEMQAAMNKARAVAENARGNSPKKSRPIRPWPGWAPSLRLIWRRGKRLYRRQKS